MLLTRRNRLVCTRIVVNFSGHLSGHPMAVPGKAESFVRFAEFELNLCTGELRTNGHKVYLQEKPFQLLSLFLERPGQLLTREELEKKLWTPDTFVDFDQSLNKAVNRLRDALNDSSEKPRFIETLPRRGYRFLAQVNDSRTSSPCTPVQPSAPGVPDSSVKRKQRVFSANAILLTLVAFGGIAFVAWLVSAPAGPTILQVRPITHDGRAKGTYAALATDGARVYFEEVLAGKELVAQVSSSGGETAINSLPVKGTPADISPDGGQLLFVAEMPSGFQLWIQPLPVGSPRRVGDLQGNDGGWAPDGEHLVFTDNTGVFWAKSDGTQVRKIAATTGTAAWAASFS
jgi:DNA-binding winged helix-turn-helix (wHTH) protein